MSSRQSTYPSRNLFIFFALGLLLPLATVFLRVAECVADTRYVRPSAEAVFRSGAASDYKVVGSVKDGDVVELLQESNSYSLIRRSDGKEGWILKRFLSVNPPSPNSVAALRIEIEKLKQRELEASQKFEELTATLGRTQTDLNAALAEKEQLKTDFHTLQQDTADVVQIKKDMARVTEENQELAQEISSVKEENNRLNKDKSVNWFLAGGGVLLAGMALGRLTSASRKRKSSLL